MRIVHLLAEPTRLGGAETYALSIAAAQAKRGDDVLMFHVRPGRHVPDGVKSCATPDAASLRTALDEHAADVLHVHGTPFDADGEAALRGRHRVRSLHDFSFACSTGEHWFRGGASCTRAHGPGCFDGMLRRGCAHRWDLRDPIRRFGEISERLPALRDDPATVVYSRVIRDAAVMNGLASERVFVAPCFVERDEAPSALTESRALAYVGRIVSAKGLDVALCALALVPQSWDELHVVGDGWARGDAEQLAASFGLTSRVTFHGWLQPGEVARVVRSSRALLMPSRWPEPFGIAGLEALALGRPVIASAIGGIPEWLSAECGILVPPGDAAALADAIHRSADMELSRRLGDAGWEHAARFSPEVHLAALDAVYRGVRTSGPAAA